MRGGFKKQKGTTLLEIVITMAIVTVGMLGFFTLYIQAFRMTDSAAAMTQASNLAVAYQDLLLAIPYTPELKGDLVFQDCSSVPLPSAAAFAEDYQCHVENRVNSLGTEDASQGKLSFYPSWHVQVIDPTADPQQIRIFVRVRYPSENGRCPACSGSGDSYGNDFREGWKAVTMTTVRTTTAF